MSPTLFRYKGYRFYFFSREEKRAHVHISGQDGEAKFWLEPIIALADYRGLNSKELKELQKVIEERSDEIISVWKEHLGN